MPAIRTLLLLLAAIMASGLLAGSNFDRAIVAMPAWVEVGPAEWANFSRHADLGMGLILYPLEALLGAALTVAAFVSYAIERKERHSAFWAFSCAVICTAAALAITAKAAPIMLSLGDDRAPIAIPRLFDEFRFWGDVRGAFHIMAFTASLWALFKIVFPNGRAVEPVPPGKPPAAGPL